jgi:hypothetical protein
MGTRYRRLKKAGGSCFFQVLRKDETPMLAFKALTLQLQPESSGGPRRNALKG